MCTGVEKQAGRAGWWNNGTIEKPEEEASVVSFPSKDMDIDPKQSKTGEKRQNNNQFPSLFSSVVQVPVSNLSKSTTYRCHSYLKFPCHYFPSFWNYHATSLFGPAYIHFPSVKESFTRERGMVLPKPDMTSIHCFSPLFISEQPFLFKKVITAMRSTRAE